MIISIKASSLITSLQVVINAFSLATNSPSYKAGLITNADVTHTTSDLSGKTQVASNAPTFGAYGWTL